MSFSQFNYYQKLNRFNSKQAGKREREEDTNGERGILTYFRRKRANANGEKGGISFKETFLMPHSAVNRYYLTSDMWTEVAKHLGVKEMTILSSTTRWLNIIFSEDYIWKCAFLRDMDIPVACQESFPWKEIYTSAFDGSHTFSLHHLDGHIHLGWFRPGAFHLSSHFVILRQTLDEPSMVPPLGINLDLSVKIIGMCCLDNARTGIWISDHHKFHCPVNRIYRGDVHVLDARHFELFMEEGYKNGTWQYEEIATTIIPYSCAVATSGIFDLTHIESPDTQRPKITSDTSCTIL